MKAANRRRRLSRVLKFEKMADNGFVGRRGLKHAPCSTDLMKEKLDKWRRMRRSLTCDVGTAVNRSRSSVSSDMNNNTHRFSKRNVKGSSLNKNGKENVAAGYKRIPDHTDNLASMKKRRKTFNVIPRKSTLIIHKLPNARRSDIADGNSKTHKDETLSMRERLEIWRAEKRKGNPERPVIKSKTMKKLNRKPAEMKENKQHFNKLQNTDLYHTPAGAKPLSQAKSTIKRTGYLAPSHPSHRKPSTMQSSCGRQSKEKSLVRATQCKRQALPSNVDRHEADFSNPETKSYKDKTLDMRERLELWLAEKGKTPKYKTPSVIKHPSWIQRSVRPAEEIKRLSFDCCAEADGAFTESVTCTISPGEGENIEDKFQECLLQLESGECDPEIIAAKLDLYSSSCPHTTQIANYWLCRARIAQQEKDFDRVVCLLEQAFVFKAQPESVLRDAVRAFVNFMKENCQQDAAVINEMSQFPVSPPKETNNDINDDSWLEEDLNSSVIKFCLTEATPYRKKFKATFGKPVLTPVRRSVRLEHASSQHPPVVQEHGLTVRTLGELPEEIQQDVLFKPNFAVRAELNEAWNQLRFDDNLT